MICTLFGRSFYFEAISFPSRSTWRICHFNDNHVGSSGYLLQKESPVQYGKMRNVILICYCYKILLQKCTVKVTSCATDNLHMMTSSNGNIFRVTGHLCAEFTGPGRGALMFTLIFAWINGSVNNGKAGDLRRHRAHYDVIVMNKTDWAINIVINFIDKPYLQ